MKIIQTDVNPLMRKIIFLILRFSFLPFLIRETRQRRKVTFIVYHDISPEIADKHFSVLKKYYNLISLTDFLESRKSGTLGTLPPKSLVVTFDDGHESNYSLKPIIEKHRIPVIIFLCSGIVGTKRHFWFRHDTTYEIESLKLCPDEQRLKILADLGFDEIKEYEYPQALTKEEIQELSQSPFFSLQSHSVTHPCLPQCSPDKSCYEISQSKTDLESNYSLHVYAFAYPNGDYSDREIALVKKAGYTCALSCDPGFNGASTAIFKLKRINMNYNSDINELLVRACGLWVYIQRLCIQRLELE
jgi:peptidoglycan/xylan/chitin deacetylase (PgdA/CDA1 family)